jgi:ATP-dependent exoDNAse (exonuclease V) beta subunit
MFDHDLVNKLSLARVATPNGRFYETPIGVLPSVTTVLDHLNPKPELKAWRERVGEKEADRIANQAATRGDAIHEMAQLFVMNNLGWDEGVPYINKATFKPVAIMLHDNVTKVYGCEMSLFSPTLKVAGTTDLFCDWMGSPTIVDYKTAKRPMKLESKKLKQYKLQATAYAMMAEELYHKTIPACVIICTPDRDKIQCFHFKNDRYRKEITQTFSAFTVSQ